MNYQQGDRADNQDFCSACSGNGYLVCCDGCVRSFHFTCLDPPLNHIAPLDEPWFCYICLAESAPASRLSNGLFAALLSCVQKKNPTAFILPEEVRDYFEGVQTGEDGEYVEVPMQKAMYVT